MTVWVGRRILGVCRGSTARCKVFLKIAGAYGQYQGVAPPSELSGWIGVDM